MKLSNFFVFILCFSAAICAAQPGIYNESDIEYQSLFMDAMIAKQTGDTETQIEKLKEIIRRDKSAHAAYYELAGVFHTTDNLELAQKNAEKAVSYNSSNQWYQLRLAEIYESNNSYEKASKVYKELLVLEDNNDLIYHKLAYNQLKSNKPDAAIKTLEELENKVGVNEETSRRIFDLHSQSGNEKLAVLALQKLSDKYPENIRFLNNLAGYLTDIGNTKEANKVFQNILKIDPNNARATMALVKKDVQVSEAPDYLRSLQSVMENMDIPLDNKIQELMPHLSNMTKEGQTTSALDDISQSLVDNYPNQAKAHAVRGDVLFYSGQFKKAEEAYSTAIKLDDRKYTLWDQWMINLWETESKEKLYTASYDAIDLFPNQVNAFVFHSIALSMKNENEEAVSYLDEAKLIAGKNEMLQTNISVVDTWIKSPNMAKDELKEKLKTFNLKNNTTPVFYEFVGDIYQMVSDNSKSKEFWNKAIELGGNPARLKKKIGAFFLFLVKRRKLFLQNPLQLFLRKKCYNNF